MEGSCNEPKSKITVSDNSDIYFIYESGTKTVDFIAPDELLDSSPSLNVDLCAGNESDTKSLQKKTGNCNFTCISQMRQVWNALQEVFQEV